jgi:hypothetical protein
VFGCLAQAIPAKKRSRPANLSKQEVKSKLIGFCLRGSASSNISIGVTKRLYVGGDEWLCMERAAVRMNRIFRRSATQLLLCRHSLNGPRVHGMARNDSGLESGCASSFGTGKENRQAT